MLLVVENMAEIVDYRNEFDPRKWQLYVKIQLREEAEHRLEPGIEGTVIMALIVFIVFIAVLIAIRRIGR